MAELLLVPGCPPGLFTKQFAEFAAVGGERDHIFSQVTPLPNVPLSPVQHRRSRRSRAAHRARHRLESVQPDDCHATRLPHTFPYLVDKFFYTGDVAGCGAHERRPSATGPGDGWFKMFEFFEVPSQMIGAIGPVAQGTNFDWLRQDTKPGLINLNLIIDEEVFFSVFGQQDQNFNAAASELLPASADRPSRERRSAVAGDVQRDHRDGGHVAHGRGAVAGSHGRDRDHGLRSARRRLPDEQRGGAGHRSGRGRSATG